jgi:sulfur-oxidizing protein SoxZ
MARVLLNVPKQAKKGEVIELKILISHPMESGQRRDEYGKAIPRDIIHEFVCTYNGEEVLHADLFPAIAANPFFSFYATAVDSGTITMSWTDDHGEVQRESTEISVVE